MEEQICPPDLLEMILDQLNTLSRLALLEGATQTQHMAQQASVVVRHLYATEGAFCPLDSEIRAAGAAVQLASIRAAAVVSLEVQRRGEAPILVRRGLVLRPLLRMIEDHSGASIPLVVTLQIGPSTVRIEASRPDRSGQVVARERVSVEEPE